MFVEFIECTKCGEKYKSGLNYNCTKCGSILDIKYDYEKIRDRIDMRRLPISGSGVWRYKELLPIENPSNIVSLNEGSTPLYKAERLGEAFGLRNLYVKDETRNPTGSFKDRPITVAVSKARELGVGTVASSSSGNAGGSLAAYAAKAGLNCIIFAPSSTLDSKLIPIALYGSRIVIVDGTVSDAFYLAKKASEEHGWFNATSTFVNPYQLEGDKTVAYEMVEQTGGEVPDWVFIPIGAGPLLVGCWKGFKELNLLGCTTKLAHMVGIQAEGCAPIVKAFRENTDKVDSWGKLTTIVYAIADPLVGYSQDGTYTLRNIRESGGVAEACSDKEILDSVKLLANKEGIFAEPAGAAVVAGAKKLLDEGKVGSDENVVCVVTGTGLKQMISERFERPKPIRPDSKELERFLEKTGL